MAKNSGNTKGSLSGPADRGKKAHKKSGLGHTYNSGGSRNLMNTPDITSPDQVGHDAIRDRESPLSDRSK